VTPAGFVFDLDGTIVDNMPIHAEAFFAFIDRHGLPPLTDRDRGRFEGKRNRDIFPDLFGRDLSEEELRRFSDDKESLYRQLSGGVLRPLRGFVRLLDLLERHRIPVAVATSAPADNVPHTLGELGLASRLRIVTRSDEVPRGKPHPDVFLEAARRIGVPPSRCLAFEDAPLGVRAARGAGMPVCGITTTFSAAAFAEHGAAPDFCCADFHEYLAGPGAWLLGARDRSGTEATSPAR
jgi:HAD superfamily hydrolase (TIGR01509 family)